MEDPGRQLRRVREALQLKYRDVEEASQVIARLRQNQEFSVGLSRLADIENKGTVPSLYRMYSLCAIYGLKFANVLEWYGIRLNNLMNDAANLPIKYTRPINFEPPTGPPLAEFPIGTGRNPLDLTKTLFLNTHLRQDRNLAFAEMGSPDTKQHRYALVGTEDWFMYPLLPPGSFVQIDETKKRIVQEGFSQEHERPIYFIEHREGYRCGWCSEKNGLLIVQPHSSSGMNLEIYRYPGEADILGQVIGVAKRLDLAKRRHTRF
ncbi:MAG TPA: hypothetical protein VHZ55_24545 [Bryobacteraceae bacterium]|nr:hypothetical protein [Bryobacteraceae bacterium]